MLMSAGLKLPKMVFGHGFLTKVCLAFYVVTDKGTVGHGNGLTLMMQGRFNIPQRL